MIKQQISRRRFLQGTALLGGMTVFAACTPPQADSGSSEDAAPESAGANILVRLNGIDAPGQEFADQFIIDYGAENNVSIEIDYTDWGSSFQKATTGLAGGSRPGMTGKIGMKALATM